MLGQEGGGEGGVPVCSRIAAKIRHDKPELRSFAPAGGTRYAHAKQFMRMRRELKRLRTYLGRVFRDVSRKIDGHADLEARFTRLLGLVVRVLTQQPSDNNKLYSLHAPEVVCISKGKAHKRYEFGCKVGITATMKRELKRRSAIEPMIGHAKNDGRLGRNYLLGIAGDKINAILAAAGHNLRLVLRRLALLFARTPTAVVHMSAGIAAICPTTTAPSA